MRLLYTCVSGQLGGAEISMLDMLAGLHSEMHAWQIGLIVPEDGPVAQRARLLNVQVRVIPFPLPFANFGDSTAGSANGYAIKRNHRRAIFRAAMGAAFYARHLRRAICDFEPDVIHAHGFKMLLLSTWSAKRGVPIIWHMHDYISSRPIMRKLLRVHSFRCAAVIANTASTAADVLATCGNRVQVRVIYYAVDADKFRPDGPICDLDVLSNLAPPKEGVIRVGLVAAMAHWKGHAVFLRAISLLSKSLPIRAYVVGGSLYKTNGSQVDPAELKMLARTLHIEDIVGFTGFVDDTASVMRRLDIVVHASTKPEPFGLVIAEAMAAGRPVIVSEEGGAAELLHISSAGLGFPPGNVTALAARIGEFARNPDLRRTMACRGPAAAKRYFGQQRLTLELMSVYRQVAPEVFEPTKDVKQLTSPRESRIWGPGT
jgi:glycosyltransferase involved in cell wall biosynthesis